MVKKERTRKKETEVMETEEGAFPGGHRASVLRAVTRVSKRSSENWTWQ